MRRRFSVLRSISLVKRIIGVYSRPDENSEFSNDRKPDKVCKRCAFLFMYCAPLLCIVSFKPLRDRAVLIKKEFFKCTSKKNYTYSLKFEKKTYNLDLKAQTCDCRIYIKDRLCCHLLKANCLFDNSTMFVQKNKRGAPKKAGNALQKE
jgi:hypothetical protein